MISYGSWHIVITVDGTIITQYRNIVFLTEVLTIKFFYYYYNISQINFVTA